MNPDLDTLHTYPFERLARLLADTSPVNDEEFARRLFARFHVRVLPGSYLGRGKGGDNPGAGHVRVALVAPLEECMRAAHCIREMIESNDGSNAK
ncbi:MAG: hypothetical protein HYR49_10350 [Gammaproteobacteria bacterium]|nr:hypothetical protein [Gammaproteobacteria bacterium]